MKKQKYNGLINEGATCYLNSLLQTLYMTTQFRKNVYAYSHDPKKINEVDSIPYQLQKLFVQMQNNKKLPSTRALLKSFQWTDADSFQQHDVQQFCRILFEVIQKSHKNAGWIAQLFEGSMISFVDCGKHLSTHSQMFMDLSLPLRNPYNTKIFNSLQECLKVYLCPETLQDKFQCQQCKQKVYVQKGLKIQSLPKILTIQLSRFELNYETMQRQKLNSFIYYPELLEMYRFMKNYKDIKIQPIPIKLKQKTIIIQKQKSLRTINYGFQQGKIKTGLIRKKSDQLQQKKQKVKFYDQQGQNNTNIKNVNNYNIKQQKQLNNEQNKQKQKTILAILKQQKLEFDLRHKKLQEKKIIENLNQDILFGSKYGLSNTVQSWNSGCFEKINYQTTNNQFQHQQECWDKNKSYPDFTYALYAVLVHAGGAYGGHYYAYIRDADNWYKFDDSTVKKVNNFQMRKYGNINTSQSIHGANAYLLFYRDVRTMNQLQQIIEIPENLIKKVNQQQQKIQIIKQQKNKRINQIIKGVILNIYYNNKFNNTIIINNRQIETIKDIKQKIKKQLNLTISSKNWRLRRYNKIDQIMQQIYTNDQQTLQNLGFRQQINLIIQQKQNQQQQFQPYNPNQIIIKINIWKENIILLTEKYLKPIKIIIHQQEIYNKLIQKIKSKIQIESEQQILIIKRNFTTNNPINILSKQQYGQKKLIELRFFNGINLFIEKYKKGDNNNNKIKWKQQFENEKYRCLIKYNNPKQNQNRDKQLYFDTRKTLGDLKNKLSQLIDININNFRIKKTKQSVSQMTYYKKKLNDLKFINTQFIYLEQGNSSIGSIIIKRGQVNIIDDKIQFLMFQEIQIELQSDILTIEDLKNKLSMKINQPIHLIRIRQFKAYQFGQIYRNTQLIHKIRQKSLIWQNLINQDPHGLQIYIRIFNIFTLQLGSLKEIFITLGANYQQLTLVIEEQTSIATNKICCWKALSNYIQKSILLDCQWSQIKYIPKLIRQQPLYINTDGQIIIIKQTQQIYHPKPYITNTNTNKQCNNKEVQLKITVVEQKNIQDVKKNDL